MAEISIPMVLEGVVEGVHARPKALLHISPASLLCQRLSLSNSGRAKQDGNLSAGIVLLPSVLSQCHGLDPVLKNPTNAFKAKQVSVSVSCITFLQPYQGMLIHKP